MKTIGQTILGCVLAFSVLQPCTVLAQPITILLHTFDDPLEIEDNNGNPWDNWFGTAFEQVTWDSSDANNIPSSGSMKIDALFPDSGIGGCCGPQFVVYNQNNGISPPLAGNGSPVTDMVVTNFQCDLRFDATSLRAANGNFPTIEIGTRGVDFGQHVWGTVTIPGTETNWVHVNLPIGPDASWATIPNLFFKHFSTALNGRVILYVDNITFIEAATEVAPPTMAIEKPPTQGLRIFAGSTANTYDREQLTSVDTNQSWVGGTYPVSYSFELLRFPKPPEGEDAVFRFHIFLVPVAHAGGNSFVNNQFIEYQAGDNLWLNVNVTNPSNVWADVSWKTNLPNANPNTTALFLTNATAVGTWTLTFTSAAEGTLSAPGASPAPFFLPAAAAARFANPLVAFFGVQPDSGWGIGKFADVARIRTTGVAAPGVPIDQNFTAVSSIATNIWTTSNSAQPSSMVLVTTEADCWVNWTFPDSGFGLGTKGDLAAAGIPWKTPVYYADNNTNSVFTAKMGNNVWSLIPKAALPTLDGSSNGVVSPNAFFQLAKPPPAE